MNTISQHLCIDLETLAFCDNAIITAIAITPFKFTEKDVTFDELVARTFYVKCDIRSQKALGRVADKSTIDWWKSQPLQLQKISSLPSPDDVPIQDAFDKMCKFVKSTEYDFKNSYTWERGMGFDTNKLDTLTRQLEARSVMNYWRAREIRTFNDLVGDVISGKWEVPENEYPKNFIEHYAKHDAAMDTFRLIKLFNS